MDITSNFRSVQSSCSLQENSILPSAIQNHQSGQRHRAPVRARKINELENSPTIVLTSPPGVYKPFSAYCYQLLGWLPTVTTTVGCFALRNCTTSHHVNFSPVLQIANTAVMPTTCLGSRSVQNWSGLEMMSCRQAGKCAKRRIGNG